MKIEISEKDILHLKDMYEIAVDDDVFDLPAYDSILRSDKINSCWESLKIIERIIKEWETDQKK